MAGDALFDHVALLLKFDGANGATTTADSSRHAHPVTLVGGATISTDHSSHGGSSLKIAGASRGASIPSSPVFALGTADFCAECWVWVTSFSPGIQTIFQIGNYTTGPFFRLQDGQLFLSTSGAYREVSTTTPTGQLLHLALQRRSGVFEMFVAGTQVDSYTRSENFAANSILIGSSAHNGGEYVNGYIDEFRLTAGQARYTGAFTPASFFPDYASQLAGVVRDTSNTPCARQVRAYRRDTGVLVGSAISDAATGAYSINSRYSGPHTLVFLPASGEPLNALVLDRVEGV